MPVVGEAHIIVRAITTNVAKDIKNGFNGVSGVGGKNAEQAGQNLSSRFMRGWSKNMDTNPFTQFANGLKEMYPQAQAGYDAINALAVSGYKFSSVGYIIAASIGTLIGALVALVAAAAGAAASFTAIIGLFIAMKAATAVAKMAFNGVGEAVQKATQQQKAQTETLKNLREELQQLKFDAEDAALAQEQAAISLEKAREGLARTADLPADSRARREAELAYKQADLNYRRAKDRSADLNEELRTGAKARAKAAADDPYANLTATQKGFAKFLVTLQPILKNLREAVASGFLPLLQKGLSKLISSGTFNDIYNGIAGIGKALGSAVKVILDFFSSAEAGKYLREIFESIQYVVQQFGPILTKFFKAFFKIMAASSPIVNRLADFISRLLDDFNALLDKTGDTGLRKFFITAADMAGKFGKIAGNILKAFGSIIMANFGPGTGGDYLLNWLIEATQGFGTMGKTGNSLKTFFNEIGVNTKKMLGGIGGIFKALVEFGADPRVGEFWVIIKQASPYFSSILKKAGQALPTVAKLVVKIVEIVDKLTDNAAIDNFFKTLLKGADTFSKIISNPVVNSIQSFTGKIHAVTLGLMELKKFAEPVTQFLFEGFRRVNAAVGKTIDLFHGAKTAVQTVARAEQGLREGIKKTMASFRAAAEVWPKYTKGVNQARQYLSIFGAKAGSTLTNATKRTRELIASQNILARGWGRTRLAVEAANLRFKIFSTLAKQNLAELTYSNNKFVAGFARVGSFMMGHPILMIIGLIAAAFITLYTTNEKFRNAINSTFKPALDALGEAFRVIMAALRPVINAFQVLMKTLFGGEKGDGQGPLTKFFLLLATLISDLIVVIAPLVAELISKLMPVVTMLLQVLTPIISVIMKIWYALQGAIFKVLTVIIKVVVELVKVIINLLMPIIDAVMAYLEPLLQYWVLMAELVEAFFDALMTNDWETFGEKFKTIGQGIVQSLADMFTGLVNLVVELLNLLIKLMSYTLRPVFDILKQLSGGTIDINASIDAGLIPKMPPITVPQMFEKGGIVSPSAGGTLGIIAEAGRPERIEPLDPDGLSKRDKAMIQMMGGSGINVTVNGTPDMDVNALAAEVSRRLAFQMRKGAV